MKKIFTLTMLGLCFCALNASADVTIKVKADAQPYIHAWQHDGGGNYTTWPGAAMTKGEGEAYWSYTITTDEAVNFLFHNNNGQQTANIENLGNGSTAYFTYDGNTSYTQLPYVAGTINAFGVDWGASDDNVMTLQGDGTYVLTKVVELKDDADVQAKTVQFGHWYGVSGENSDNLYIHGTNGKAGTYTINVYFNPNTFVSSFTLSAAFNGYYLVGGTGEWAVGDKLTENNGTYSITVTPSNGTFAFVPNTALSGYGVVTDWTTLVHPTSATELGFVDYSNQGIYTGDNNNNWSVSSNNDADIVISYEAAGNTWSVTQTDAVAVGAAGWASYSNSYAFKADKDAYVISSIADGYAKLTKVDAGTTFAAEAGVLFQENTTITPATGDTYDGDNKLSGSGNSGATITTDDLVLGVSDGVPGFYMLSTTTLPAHKAYLTAANAAGASAISLVFDDEQTGINNVNSDQQGMAIYSLQGVRQQSLKKGLNIVGGKKLLVK